jgi:4-alpha-glucanotransferase
MKVMQFAFDSREAGDYLPENYTENSVCYSGTHDNTTLLGWSREAAPEDVEKAWQYLGKDRDEDFVSGMIRLCMESRSKLCVIQLQDWLSLGAEARMNTPGLLSESNWSWRADEAMLTEALAKKIRTATQTHQRT